MAANPNRAIFEACGDDVPRLIVKRRALSADPAYEELVLDQRVKTSPLATTLHTATVAKDKT